MQRLLTIAVGSFVATSVERLSSNAALANLPEWFSLQGCQYSHCTGLSVGGGLTEHTSGKHNVVYSMSLT